MAIAPLIIRWGADASSDKLRRCARCTKCSHKGATIQVPSWYSNVVGHQPASKRAIDMLSFTVVKSGHAFQICCDEVGLSKLIDVLNKVRETGHTHLRTPPGGNVLSAKSPAGEEAVYEVIITLGGD